MVNQGDYEYFNFLVVLRFVSVCCTFNHGLQDLHIDHMAIIRINQSLVSDNKV